MVFHQISREDRIRRNRTNEAISLAMQSRWEEAIAVNQTIIEMFPEDADAYNRLGKALAQTGRHSEAREAYSRAVEIEPNNGIARKNLERLAHLVQQDIKLKTVRPLRPQLFLEETGKATITELHQLAPSTVLAKIAAGDPVVLKTKGQVLVAESLDGEYIGQMEPRLSFRLTKLLEGGNRYAGAIASITPDSGRIMIKEVFQHPSQVGRPSFPARAPDDFRPYVKGTLLKYEQEDEDEEEYTGEPERQQTLPEEAKSLEEMAMEEEELDEDREM